APGVEGSASWSRVRRSRAGRAFGAPRPALRTGAWGHRASSSPKSVVVVNSYARHRIVIELRRDDRVETTTRPLRSEVEKPTHVTIRGVSISLLRAACAVGYGARQIAGHRRTGRRLPPCGVLEATLTLESG